MTLNVSLRVPDGIVLASDSLATLLANITQKMNVTAKCNQCGTNIDLKDVQTPPMQVPSSTWPFTQKMHPVSERFGLATWGQGMVNGRSIYNHVAELVFPMETVGQDLLLATANFIRDYFSNQLVIELTKAGNDPTLLPDTFLPLGFQLVGFSKDTNGEPQPASYLISIGPKPRIQSWTGIGWAWTGDPSVVNLLYPGGNLTANVFAFSLQDAIDFAKFLIKTTADFQRFSGNLPTVGGDIDIALITNRHGFRWIAQKELYRTLDTENTR